MEEKGKPDYQKETIAELAVLSFMSDLLVIVFLSWSRRRGACFVSVLPPLPPPSLPPTFPTSQPRSTLLSHHHAP
jgi:hypothetical protein